MRARVATTALLAAVLMVGTAGCTFLTPQATLLHYEPSSGFSADVGDMKLRNVFAVSSDGVDATLIGVIINTGSVDENVIVQYSTHDGGTTSRASEALTVPAGGSLSLGTPGIPQIVLKGVDVQPGALLPIFVQYADVTGKAIDIPMLDGTLPAYKRLIPTPEPSAKAKISTGVTTLSTPSPSPSK